MRFCILCASLTNQINAGYSPCPSLFVVGTFIACSYTSVVAFAKYLEILLMASFELCIAAYQYGGGWVVYFNPYCDCFDVVCNEEYGFIYTYQSCYRNLCFPKDQISTIKQNTVYTQKKGEANQRSIFHSQTTVLSLSQFFPSMDPNTLYRKLSVIPTLHVRKQSGHHHTLLQLTWMVNTALVKSQELLLPPD